MGGLRAISPLRHEPDRVSVRLVALAASLMVAAAILTHIGVYIFVRSSRTGKPRSPEPAVAMFEASRDWGAAGRDELRDLRERERRHLEDYQWLDAGHTSVRIPIERAMELLVPQPRPEEAGPP